MVNDIAKIPIIYRQKDGKQVIHFILQPYIP